MKLHSQHFWANHNRWYLRVWPNVNGGRNVHLHLGRFRWLLVIRREPHVKRDLR